MEKTKSLTESLQHIKEIVAIAAKLLPSVRGAGDRCRWPKSLRMPCACTMKRSRDTKSRWW